MKPTIRIEELLSKLKLTQSELAEKAGVNVLTVWRWKKYGVPTRGSAQALLERLDQDGAA